MPTTAGFIVTARGVSKSQAAVLLLEFWTSKGFSEHTASYNRLVLRRNGYGTLARWLECNLFAGTTPWSEVPTELTVLIQTRPDHTSYDMTFALGGGIEEQQPAGFRWALDPEVAEFVSFINDWTAHARRELE